MSYKGFDNGSRHETGEKVPMRAQREDERGERRNSVPKRDREDASNNKGKSGESFPKNTKSSDESGEHRSKLAAGVGMGKADDLKGRDPSHLGKPDGLCGEHNTGKTEGHFYNHAKEGY